MLVENGGSAARTLHGGGSRHTEQPARQDRGWKRRKESFQHLQVLWLLPELHEMLPVQLPLSPLVVFQLVLELSLVLQPDQVHSQLLQRVQLPVLQLARRLVVPDQHCMLHFLLGPLLV